jgi:endoglucanase
MLLKSFWAASAALAVSAQETPQSKLKWFGINESGAEFGEKNFTGVYGREYIWYDLNAIDQFMAQGMNMFRLNFRKSRNYAAIQPRDTDILQQSWSV